MPHQKWLSDNGNLVSEQREPDFSTPHQNHGILCRIKAAHATRSRPKYFDDRPRVFEIGLLKIEDLAPTNGTGKTYESAGVGYREGRSAHWNYRQPDRRLCYLPKTLWQSQPQMGLLA